MTLGRRTALGCGIGMALALAGLQAHAQSAFPDRWQSGDAPPDFEGIRLGDPRERVLQLFGEPDPSPLGDDPAASLHTLRYRDGALLIATDASNAVARIMLSRPEGGALAGIRVGDRIGAMLRGWGEPTQSRGSVGRYQIDDWTIMVRADLAEQKVLKLMLARMAPQ